MQTMDLAIWETQMAIRSHTRVHWIKPHRKAFIKVQQNSMECVYKEQLLEECYQGSEGSKPLCLKFGSGVSCKGVSIQYKLN